MPFFSVIVPVYNVAPYLRESLDSVCVQTFTDWEAICVDDGSTDDSGAILDEYAVKDRRFRVIHQKNASVSAARNAALEVAQGEYVWFVDGDDAVHPGALSFLKEQFDRFKGAEMLLFGGFITDVPDVWPSLDEVEMRFVRGINSTTYNHAHVAVWMSVFKKSAIGGMRFEPFAMSEDTLFIETALWCIGAAICGEAPLYVQDARRFSNRGGVSQKKQRNGFRLSI